MTKAEVDMSNQIDNSWTKNTVLGIVQDNLKYSVMLKFSDKSTIKKICEENTKYLVPNKKTKSSTADRKIRLYFLRAVSLTHAYLLHKLLTHNKTALEHVKVCKDTIATFLDNSLRNIMKHNRTSNSLQHIKVKYGLRKKNNTVQKYAREVMKGRLPADYVLTTKDIKEIIDLISKFVPKN